MKQVLGIRDENARMKVTPPLAVAPLLAQEDEDDMRYAMEQWNPREPEWRMATALFFCFQLSTIKGT